MNMIKLAAAIALSTVAASGPALAATAQADLGVSITIQAACTVTGGSVGFGTVGLLDTAVPATGTFSVKCTNSTGYTIGLDAGLTPGATVTTRQMRKGTAAGAPVVNYSLAMDSATGANWGNTSGAWKSGVSGTGLAQTYTVYGNVPVQTTPEPGTYNDTVKITVTY